jgi:hypothetical protein
MMGEWENDIRRPLIVCQVTKFIHDTNAEGDDDPMVVMGDVLVVTTYFQARIMSAPSRTT